jgi:hypothetical protein
LLASSIVALNPTPGFTAAPVGSSNPSTFTGTASDYAIGGLGFSLLNAEASADALLVVSNSATATGRSVGLVSAGADSASGLALTQTATVALSGVLSLYALATTSSAISWDGGTLVATGTALSTITGSYAAGIAIGDATAVGFSHPEAASSVAHIRSILWRAPSAAGTYVIEHYIAATPGTSPNVPTGGAPTLGTKVGKITVTVGGSHGVSGGTNQPATLGGINASLFTAIATNNGSTAIAHPATNLGTGETSALSKGLLSKDTSFRAAQTATVLTGGILSLYAYVSTTAAFSASGGTFSDSGGTPATFPTATYSSNNRTSLITGATNSAHKTIFTLWNAPTTAGTYTISLYVAAGTGEPSLAVPEISVAGRITVSVVASSAGGSYSAAYSACRTAVNTTSNYNALVTSNPAVDSSGAVKNGDQWSIDFDLNDAYAADLDDGNIVVTATNGALVNLGTAGTTPVAGTASTDVEFGSASTRTVRIDQGTAGAPMTTTVTITYNGTTVCSKTVTIRGKVAKIAVANVGTQDLSEDDGSSQWMYEQIGLYSPGMFTILATDSAGNIVATDGLGTFSADAATLTTVVQAATFPRLASSVSSTSTSRFTLGSFQCGSTAGSANIKVKFTTTSTGEAITSDAFTARCADNPDTYTVSLDKAAYKQGDIATATVQFLDSKGNKANSVTAVGANSWVLPYFSPVTFSGTLAAGASATAVTKADGSVTYIFSVGASEVAVTGSYAGVVTYNVPANGVKQTVQYSLVAGSDDVAFSEVLKSVIALIASINKQIQALQKLILKNRGRR